MLIHELAAGRLIPMACDLAQDESSWSRDPTSHLVRIPDSSTKEIESEAFQLFSIRYISELNRSPIHRRSETFFLVPSKTRAVTPSSDLGLRLKNNSPHARLGTVSNLVTPRKLAQIVHDRFHQTFRLEEICWYRG